MDRRTFLACSAAAAGTLLTPDVSSTLAQCTTTRIGRPSKEGFPAGDLLFEDTFSSFPAGLLSHPVGQLNGAVEEVHYLPHRGVPLSPWVNAISHMDAWVASDEEGQPYIEQHLVNDLASITNPILLTGEAEWSGYAVEVKIKPLSIAEMVGLIFRYHTNRHYYLFAITGGHIAQLVVRLPQ